MYVYYILYIYTYYIYIHIIYIHITVERLRDVYICIYITLHYVTSHCIALHHITLHYKYVYIRVCLKIGYTPENIGSSAFSLILLFSLKCHLEHILHLEHIKTWQPIETCPGYPLLDLTNGSSVHVHICDLYARMYRKKLE